MHSPGVILASIIQQILCIAVLTPHVIYIFLCSQLMRLNLSGELAPEVGKLSYLEIL